jgi:hypothetical protein
MIMEEALAELDALDSDEDFQYTELAKKKKKKKKIIIHGVSCSALSGNY